MFNYSFKKQDPTWRTSGKKPVYDSKVFLHESASASNIIEMLLSRIYKLKYADSRLPATELHSLNSAGFTVRKVLISLTNWNIRVTQQN